MAGQSYINGAVFYQDLNEWLLPGMTTEITDFIEKELALQPQDILIAGYPRTGTNWVSAIASLIRFGGNIEAADQIPLHRRVILLDVVLPLMGTGCLNFIPSPRIYKSHLSYPHLKRIVEEQKSKVIYVTRDPKDTILSYYHFHRMNLTLGKFNKPWEDFFKLVKDKNVLYGDVVDHGKIWQEKTKNLPNVLKMSYEELHADHRGSVVKMADFLGVPLEDTTIDRITAATTFLAMKENPATNYLDVEVFDSTVSAFLRSGKIGGWKEVFSPEQSAYFDEA